MILMGKIKGHHRVGRRRSTSLKSIKDWTGAKSVEQLYRLLKTEKGALNKQKKTGYILEN